MRIASGRFHLDANGIASTVVGNLLPLIGVLYAGWDIYTLLVTYWCETLVIAFWTVITIAFHKGTEAWSFSGPTQRNVVASTTSAAFIALHAGFFIAVHLFLMSVLYGAEWPGHLRSAWTFIDTFVIGQGLWPVLAFLFLQRAVAFWDDRRTPSVLPVIVGLYLRILVMQVVIIIGAWGVMLFGSGLWGLVLLVGLKTGLDLLWPRLIEYAVDNFYQR